MKRQHLSQIKNAIAPLGQHEAIASSEISQEKATQIAGLNRRDFISALAREQVDIFVVDFDDLQRELDRG